MIIVILCTCLHVHVAILSHVCAYIPADATVGFAKSAVNITEGEVLEVCLELSMVPAGGVACDITATLAAQPSLYGKQGTDINS